MFHTHTLQKVNTCIQTFLSLFLLKFFLSSILLLDPPTLSSPLPLYSLFLFPSHPYLPPTFLDIWIHSPPQVSFPQLLQPPIPLSTSLHPHLQSSKLYSSLD